ncbi:unnamed protein product [Didymodactylos carnosus]|uniref:Uncharacterized protein n=1 Tax=Didymodactylos carnosus TaxID=1234261 RepID=A0A813NJZ8_9BILA|nr:unnamed protein product [Didymodactylos carnosus]CAF1358298.1 unnamed protein product [Didymodactylos carnosus]CAF3514785.1 unnamed protein product [Didymodactylos carnosus]CAF4168696.1 unnamed protein product [Didymodactylos carnosus]
MFIILIIIHIFKIKICFSAPYLDVPTNNYNIQSILYILSTYKSNKYPILTNIYSKENTHYENLLNFIHHYPRLGQNEQQQIHLTEIKYWLTLLSVSQSIKTKFITNCLNKLFFNDYLTYPLNSKITESEKYGLATDIFTINSILKPEHLPYESGVRYVDLVENRFKQENDKRPPYWIRRQKDGILMSECLKTIIDRTTIDQEQKLDSEQMTSVNRIIPQTSSDTQTNVGKEFTETDRGPIFWFINAEDDRYGYD